MTYAYIAYIYKIYIYNLIDVTYGNLKLAFK